MIWVLPALLRGDRDGPLPPGRRWTGTGRGRRAAGGRRRQMRPRAGRASWDSVGPCPPRSGAEDQKEARTCGQRRVRPDAPSAARAGRGLMGPSLSGVGRGPTGTLPWLRPPHPNARAGLSPPPPAALDASFCVQSLFSTALPSWTQGPSECLQWRAPGCSQPGLVTSLNSQGSRLSPLVPLSSLLAQVWCPSRPQKAGHWGLVLCPLGVDRRG